MEKEIDAGVEQKFFSELLDQILEFQPPTDPLKLANLNEEMLPNILGPKGDLGDFQGPLSGSNLRSKVIKTELGKNTPPSEQSGRLSKIPRANNNQKNAQSKIPVKPSSRKKNLAEEMNKMLHEEILPKSGVVQDLPQKKDSKILQNIVSTEDLSLNHLEPVLDQKTTNADFIAENDRIMLEKDAEISELSKLHTEQTSIISNLRKTLKEFEEKLSDDSLSKKKELEMLRYDFQKICKVQKMWAQKEIDMTMKIENLELQVKLAQEREQILFEKEKDMSKFIADFEKNRTEPEKIHNLKKALDDVKFKLRRAGAELETKRNVVEKNEQYDQKYLKQFEKMVREEQELTKQKFEDMKIWEDELKLREECYENNRSVKKMRDALMELLLARPQWHIE